MKYKNRYTVKLMCKVLKISESGYYRWLKNRDKPSKRQLLPVKIKEILSEHPDNANYGYDRIHKALEICGIKVSRNTVYRAMKEGSLIHKSRKPHGITKASTEIQDKENLIKRDFTAAESVKKLLTDITEVQCSDGEIYNLPSASIGDTKCGMYEPIHGSAPDIAGQNKSNPIATILSAAMMLRYSFDLETEAKNIEKAVDDVLKAGFRTADILGASDAKPLSCTEMTEKILEQI